MREILFRGKRLDNGEWAAGHYLTRRTNDHGLQHMISVQDMWGFHEVDPETVGQFTGWQDYTKEKAFEGDKVLDINTGKTFTIIWDDIGAGFLFSEEDGSGGIDYYEFEDLCGGFDWRIVGSIHDDLLKGEEA